MNQQQIDTIANAIVAIQNSLADMKANPLNMDADVLAIESNLTAFTDIVAQGMSNLQPVATESLATQAIETPAETPVPMQPSMPA